MHYGLKPHIIEILKSVFTRYPKIEQVILYGSRAKGNYKKESDIDFTIMGEGFTALDLNKLITDIDELLIPYTVDISIYNQIDNNNLLELINRAGIEFYKKSPQEDSSTSNQ